MALRGTVRVVAKWVWRTFKVLATTTLVLLASIILVLYLDLSVTRRFVTRIANHALLPVFQGRLTIEHLGKLRFDGIDGTRVRVVDPAGHVVFVVDGLHARIQTLKLIRGLLASPIRVDLDIPTASIDHVDFTLDTDPGGVPLVAAAFTPRPAAETSGSTKPGPVVKLVISQALIKHAWVHGDPTWFPWVDSELTDVDGKVVVKPGGALEVDVRHASLAARALPVGGDGSGTVNGKVRVPSEQGNAAGVDWAFRGSFAGVDQVAHFSLDGDVVAASLDLNDVSPDKVRAFVPEYPLQDVVSAHVGARGTFPLLDVDVRAQLRGGGTLAGAGQATLSEKKSATLHAKLAAIDLRGLALGLPASSLGAGVDLGVSLDADSNVTGAATVELEGGTLGAFVLPAAEARGTFAHGSRSGNQAEAKVTLHEPGLAGGATLRLEPKGASYSLAFDARAESSELAAIPRLHLPLRGAVRVSAKGTLSVDELVMNGDVDAEASNLASRGLSAPGERPTFAAKTATVKAHMSGSIFLPVGTATLHADSVDVANLHSASADVTARGPISAPHVHVSLAGGDAPNLDAEADLTLGATTIISELKATLSRGSDSVWLRADKVRISADALLAEQITVGGPAGEAHGQFHLAPHTFAALAEGRRLDVAAMSRIAGVDTRCTKGELSFDVDAAIHGGKAQGRATLDVTDASILDINGAAAHAEVVLDDERLGGQVHVELGKIGSADLVATHVHLEKQELSSLRTWQRMWGTLELNANVDLAELEADLPKDTLPFGGVSGRVVVAAKAKRISVTDNAPELDLTVTTSQLVVEGKAASERVLGETSRPKAPVHKKGEPSPPSWRIEGIDLGVDARLEGETGFAEIAGRLTDAKGPLLALDLKSTAVPYSALLADPKSARELLSQVVFDAHISLPKRDLSTLPPLLDLGGTEGSLQADLDARGTLKDPSVDLKANLSGANADSTRLTLPVDLDLGAHYTSGAANAELTAQSAKHGKVLAAEAHFDGRIDDLLSEGLAAPWHAAARAHVDRFPLGAIGALEDRQVHGDVSGDVELKGLHEEASVTLDLVVPALLVGEVKYKEARVKGSLDGHAVDVTAELLEDTGHGAANAHARAQTTWGSALLPRLAENGSVDVTAAAKELRAETLLPFAHDWLAELEGKISGNAHLAYDPKDGRPRLDGKLTFDAGKFELASALGEFHDAHATLVLTPDGLAKLENASASGATGRIEAAASARLSLDASNRLSFGSARAKVLIPKKQGIPVTVEGTPMGTIDGTITVSEDPLPGGKGIKIGVEIPTLHVLLPQSGNRSVQGLGDIEDARIEAKRGAEVVTIALGPEDQSRSRAADAKRIEITAHLGDDVELRRGTDLKVGLTGQAMVTITDTAHVTGQLQLKKGGLLDVEGKSFEIENGSVSFVGDDPGNPQVVVTAGWTAPEGTRVYADYIGPLKTGKVTLRSQPPLAKSDIVALLLFGSAEGSSGPAQGQGATNTATNQAAGLAGGVATQPVNHALDQFGIHAVSARVDTSQAANPKPEVELQVAKDISVQIAQVLGTPAPGANPDTTLLTLNWRFLKSLSLSTTVGNYGSSIVDMVWQRRY
jgi:translocation and assembly module TamB